MFMGYMMDQLKPHSLLLQGNLISVQWIREFSELNMFSILVHEVPLYEIDGVWCAMSASWVIGIIFFKIINSHRYVPHVLIPILFAHLSNYGRHYDLLQQDNGKAHMADNSVRCLESVFGSEQQVGDCVPLFDRSEPVRPIFLLVGGGGI